MSLRTDLLKGLQNYAIFIPQLTRPVLRVLIQGKQCKVNWMQNSIKKTPNIYISMLVVSTISFGALHWESCLRSRSIRSRTNQIITDWLWDTGKFPWTILSDTANHAIVSTHTEGQCSRRRSAWMLEANEFHWRMHRWLHQSPAQLPRFANTKLLRSEKYAFTTETLAMVYKHFLDWKVKEKNQMIFMKNLCTNISLIILFQHCHIYCMCSGVERIAQPIIVFHILMQNGEYKTFEIPIALFHRLRYTIACLLREFQMIESRQRSRR